MKGVVNQSNTKVRHQGAERESSGDGRGFMRPVACSAGLGACTKELHPQLADVLRRFGERLVADFALGTGRSVRRPVTYLWRTLAISV